MNHRLAARLTAALSILATPAAGHADSPADGPPGLVIPAQHRSRRLPRPVSAAPAEAYVGQIVVADLLSLALVVAGHRGSSSGGVTALGVVGLLGAAPVIHASHDRGGAALASLTLRVVTPLAGFSLGLDAAKARCAEREGDYFCGHDEALVGYLGGVAIASVVDAALLAHPRRPDRSSRHRPIALIPVPVADGLGLTLFGAL